MGLFADDDDGSILKVVSEADTKVFAVGLEEVVPLSKEAVLEDEDSVFVAVSKVDAIVCVVELVAEPLLGEDEKSDGIDETVPTVADALVRDGAVDPGPMDDSDDEDEES